MTDYDLLILGGGPAGLTAGIYAGRALLKVASENPEAVSKALEA